MKVLLLWIYILEMLREDYNNIVFKSYPLKLMYSALKWQWYFGLKNMIDNVTSELAMSRDYPQKFSPMLGKEGLGDINNNNNNKQVNTGYPPGDLRIYNQFWFFSFYLEVYRHGLPISE